METELSLLWAALPASIVIAVATAVIVYLKRRKMESHDSFNTAGVDKASAQGLADKVKKAVAEKPPWLIMPLAVTGGWLFLLFLLYELLTPVWSWLLAHPELLWMPPLAFIAAQMLYATKKKPANYLAHTILAVLLIAFFAAIPWKGSGSGNTAVMQPPATQRNTAILTPFSWTGCEPLPDREPARIGDTVTQTLFAPVGTESLCYIIRDGYRLRMNARAPLRVRWQNGTVLNLSPDPTKMTNLGTIWYAAFVISSDGGNPARLTMRFEKYAQ